MRLSDLIARDAMAIPLAAVERKAVLTELVAAMQKVGAIKKKNVETMVTALLTRERRGSTGYGKGVAVPHVQHAAAEKLVATVGLSPDGVDFDALDRAPVHSFILLVGPPTKTESFQEAMNVVWRHLQADNFRRFLRQARSADEVAELIAETDDALGLT
jgi:mannitol/fructose-specific phosphotransferase system IIA component (Ntr-type)